MGRWVRGLVSGSGGPRAGGGTRDGGAHALLRLAARSAATSAGAWADEDGLWRPRRAALGRERRSQVRLCVARTEGVTADAAVRLLRAAGASMPL